MPALANASRREKAGGISLDVGDPYKACHRHAHGEGREQGDSTAPCHSNRHPVSPALISDQGAEDVKADALRPLPYVKIENLLAACGYHIRTMNEEVRLRRLPASGSYRAQVRPGAGRSR